MKIFRDHFNNDTRISDERWDHICTQHPECKSQIELIEKIILDPDLIQEGSKGENLAIKFLKKSPISENKYGVVVYKSGDPDGFVITAYFTRRPSFQRKLIWKK